MEQSSSVASTPGRRSTSNVEISVTRRKSPSKIEISSSRPYFLKVTPIDAIDLLDVENPTKSTRHVYCTLVLLDKDLKEIKGEKQKTPVIKGTRPCWSPLKAEVCRAQVKNASSHQPLGLGAAAASEEYTFGKTIDLREAKYLLVKCKDKNLVEDDDLGRLLLSIQDLDVIDDEKVAWYPLQLRPGSKMKRVQGKIRISARICREPNRWQLWSCARQMINELDIRDRNFYLKSHPQCFTGKDAIEWMLRHGPNRQTNGGISCSSEEEAILLGNAFMRANIIHHVAGDRLFENSNRQFYRFSVHHPDIIKQNESLNEMAHVLAGHYEEVEASSKSSIPVLEKSFSENNISKPTKISSSSSSSRLKIEDFQLLKVLGTGTFGKVVSARAKDGKVYAIKIVSKIGMDEFMRQNTKMERNVLSEVNHPFVAFLSFAFQNEDKLYMGMEFFNGGDLRYHFLMHERNELLLTDLRIRFYVAEIVLGLLHLHNLGIIYRDLKPENILIDKQGHIKLVDFGLSKTGMSSGQRAISLVGSPDYIAPEVLLASSSNKNKNNKEKDLGYDETCDWWSLGILIFEMYVGRTPFRDANTQIMYRNILEGSLFLPPDLEKDTKSLLEGLICRDAKNRLGGEKQKENILNHEYFSGLDWNLLKTKQIQAPWIPDVINDAEAKYVDHEFIHQVPIDTPEWRMLDSVDRAREHFQDFTFRPTDFVDSKTSKKSI